MSSAPFATAVRTELNRIVASERFCKSDQLTRFLTFTVEAALNGRVEEVKEIVLGMEVFGRVPPLTPELTLSSE
jgi:hypothetical protein